MRLVNPSYEILTNIHGLNILKNIESAGRTCYKSESSINDKSCVEFVRKIMKRGHLSVIEHESVSVKFIIDTGISHELVRHRLCAFSQESTRYCNYGGDDITFVIPPWLDLSPMIYHYPDEMPEHSSTGVSQSRSSGLVGETIRFLTILCMYIQILITGLTSQKHQ